MVHCVVKVVITLPGVQLNNEERVRTGRRSLVMIAVSPLATSAGE
jgi:hypothetical protein